MRCYRAHYDVIVMLKKKMMDIFRTTFSRAFSVSQSGNFTGVCCQIDNMSASVRVLDWYRKGHKTDDQGPLGILNHGIDSFVPDYSASVRETKWRGKIS